MLLVTMSTRYVKETTSLATTIYPTDWYPQPPTFQYLQEGSDSIANLLKSSQYRYSFLGLMTGIVRRLQLGRRLPRVTSRSNSRSNTQTMPQPGSSLSRSQDGDATSLHSFVFMPYVKPITIPLKKAIMTQILLIVCAPREARKTTLLGTAPHNKLYLSSINRFIKKCHPFSNMPNMQYADMKPKASLLKRALGNIPHPPTPPFAINAKSKPISQPPAHAMQIANPVSHPLIPTSIRVNKSSVSRTT